MYTVAEFNEIGKEIEDLLYLKSAPIAIKVLYDENEVPEGCYVPSKDRDERPALCQAFAQVRRNRRWAWIAALLVVSINTGAYMAESVRGGIISIDPGQTEGAKAIGMTHVQTMVNVIMPQALRNIIPQIGNNFIINIKDTSVMFVIGFVEFFATHRNIVGVNLLYFPSAVIEMVGYLTLTLLASFGLRWLEKWLDGDDNYELVSEDSLAMSAGTYSHPSRKTPFDEQSKEFSAKQELEKEKRERTRQGLKFGRPKGDR